ETRPATSRPLERARWACGLPFAKGEILSAGQRGRARQLVEHEVPLLAGENLVALRAQEVRLVHPVPDVDLVIPRLVRSLHVRGYGRYTEEQDGCSTVAHLRLPRVSADPFERRSAPPAACRFELRRGETGS